MIAKFKIFNTLSRNDDDFYEIYKSRDMLKNDRLIPETSDDSNIKLMLAEKPLEVLRYNTYKSYCNNAVVYLEEGDTISLYPKPEGFLAVEIKEPTTFTIKSITRDSITVEVKNRKKGMNVSNGETELGKLMLNELTEDTAELVINAGITYYSFIKEKEAISQHFILIDILEKENENV